MITRSVVHFISILTFSIFVLISTSGISDAFGQDKVVRVPSVPANAVQRIGPIKGKTRTAARLGDFAYVGVGDVIAVIDEGSEVPVTRGQTVSLNGDVQEIFIADDIMYVAAGTAGIAAFDVSSNAASEPQNIWSVDTRGFAQDIIVVAEDRLLVADGSNGLSKYDISGRTPVLLGTLATPGDDVAVDVSGQIACVASEEEGMRLIDIEQLVKIGSYSSPGDVKDCKFDENGSTVLLAAGGAGLEVVSVDQLSEPTKVGQLERLYARKLFVRGSRVYVAGERDGVWVADISNRNGPRQIEQIDVPGAATDVDVTAGGDFTISDGAGAAVTRRSENSATARATAATATATRFLRLADEPSNPR